MSWYFLPYRQEIPRDAEPRNAEERAKAHGLIVSERWGVKYYACPYCGIDKTDISEAITCKALCHNEAIGRKRYPRFKAQTVEAEAEYSS